MSKIYKSVFTVVVHTVSLALKFPCVVSVTWRRGMSVVIEVKRFRRLRSGGRLRGEW
jgi:hypothetical protein